MRLFVLPLALAATLIAAGSASADAPPDRAMGRYPVVRETMTYGAVPYRPHRRRHVRSRGLGGGFAVGPAYGPQPPLYPGYDLGAPSGPVAISEYREAYIGRGLFYNTPPQPYFPTSAVISVNY